MSQSSSTLSGAQGPSYAASSHSPMFSASASTDASAMYNRQPPYNPAYGAPGQTPYPSQYPTYSSVGHVWAGQAQQGGMYEQGQEYQRGGPWAQYNFDGGSMAQAAPQFAAAQQTMSLPLQQRQGSQMQPQQPQQQQYGQYGQYFQHGTSPE